MSKTITVFDWPGGGTWGLHQLVFAHFLEELSGLSISELSDVNFGRSVGAVGATSSFIKNPDNPSQPKFKMSEIIETFYSVAHNIFGNTKIYEHQKRGVEHDLRKAHDGQHKRRIFRDYSDGLHLDHSKMAKALTACYGDTKFHDLLKTTIILSQHFESSTTAAHTHLNPQLFDTQQWGIIQNLGDSERVVDAVMSSTAAPTVFNAYTYDGGKNHYIDNASNYGPYDALLNMERMHGKGVNFRVVTLGTGNISGRRRDANAYSNSGWLGISQGHTDALANESLTRDYERMLLTFNGISHFVLDTNLSNVQRDGKSYAYTPFAGEISDLDFIIDTAVQSAQSQTEIMKQLIEDICEDRIREEMPAIASTRVTEAFYKALRRKLPRITPIKAITYENAILRAENTDTMQHETFSTQGITKMAKGDLKNLHNTTSIPQSAMMKAVSKIPAIRKILNTNPPIPTAT